MSKPPPSSPKMCPQPPARALRPAGFRPKAIDPVPAMVIIPCPVRVAPASAITASFVTTSRSTRSVAAQVKELEAAVKSDEAAVESARVQLAYCHIAAPISGRVGLRLVDAGNIVHASDTNPLLVITELQPITVIFNVAE